MSRRQGEDPLLFNVENLNYWNSLSPCAVDQLLKSPDRPLRVVTILIRPVTKGFLRINDK